jgi:hypothetical protein
MSSEVRDEGPRWRANVADAEAGVELPVGSTTIRLTGSFRDLAASLLTDDGDTVSAAVEEKRCIGTPIGCGQALINDDGTPRFNEFSTREEAQLYESEWYMTGMCPTCQDRAEAAAKAADEEQPTT